jgi:anti-sigma B factor antagonist
MNCVRTDSETESRLSIEGSLDALTAAENRPVFDKVIADGRRRVIVDASKLTLLDSSGVGAIVSLYKRLKADGGQFSVVGANGQPLAVLKLLKLDRVFGI